MECESYAAIEILEQVYGKLNLGRIRFSLHFYKICETKEYEHYAAYRCVESERPNFICRSILKKPSDFERK